ncbi:uncharacterized protein LOC101846881, partial [Aplysia californica]|uniref:Uncharacterized protein LOC101846881 n=1 Tax=Aplysia californica TaxID=6500 RepID=A0ABM1VSS9_APLCA
MGAARQILLLGIFFCLLPGVFGQTFNFAADPFTFDPSCGLENLNGNWSAQGTLTITAAELVDANPQISIQTTSELCTVDISNCNVTSPSTIDACYCTGRTGDVYTLFVRRRARSSQSGASLTAVVIPSDPFLANLAKTDIGTLPLIYNTLSASLQVDEDPPIDLPTNQNVSVSGSENVTLKFCVANLLPGYTLTINVAGQTNTNTDGCLELTVTQPITVETATLSFVETDGCGRTDSFMVTLRGG